MTTYLESSDDGYITYIAGSYVSVSDYYDAGSNNYCIGAYWHHNITSYDPTRETRAYKRFVLGLSSSVTVQSATLNWYLNSVPSNDAQLGCQVEQINDYGVLGSTDWGITVKHDYGGAVMAYNEAAGWKTLDVTTEIEASKTDAYVAFRWRIPTEPAEGKTQSFYIKAYDNTAYKAYLAITLTTGWAHKRTGLANASLGKLSGLAKASIGKVSGLA
jgi:hypothetical protein